MNIRHFSEPLWRDVPIRERLDQLEDVLKTDPDPRHRAEAKREYLDLTTDPKEQPNG